MVTLNRLLIGLLDIIHPRVICPYQDKIKDLVPNYAYILKNTTVEKGMKQLGDKFNAPVKVQSGQGYTYNTDGSAFALNAAIGLQMENALVPAFSLIRRDNISYTAISRSAGKNSFGKAVDITLRLRGN